MANERVIVTANDVEVWEADGLSSGFDLLKLANQAFNNAKENFPDQTCKLLVDDLVVREWHP